MYFFFIISHHMYINYHFTVCLLRSFPVFLKNNIFLCQSIVTYNVNCQLFPARKQWQKSVDKVLSLQCKEKWRKRCLFYFLIQLPPGHDPGVMISITGYSSFFFFIQPPFAIYCVPRIVYFIFKLFTGYTFFTVSFFPW